MRRLALPAVALALASLAACGPSQPAEPEAKPAAIEQPDNCLTATAGAITKLQDDITATSGATAFNGHGVVASTNSDMWFIAVDFTIDGEGDYAGVWGTQQDPTANDDIAYVAVDEVAEASGTYLQPKDFDKVGITLDGAKEALACIA